MNGPEQALFGENSLFIESGTINLDDRIPIQINFTCDNNVYIEVVYTWMATSFTTDNYDSYCNCTVGNINRNNSTKSFFIDSYSEKKIQSYFSDIDLDRFVVFCYQYDPDVTADDLTASVSYTIRQCAINDFRYGIITNPSIISREQFLQVPESYYLNFSQSFNLQNNDRLVIYASCCFNEYMTTSQCAPITIIDEYNQTVLNTSICVGFRRQLCSIDILDIPLKVGDYNLSIQKASERITIKIMKYSDIINYINELELENQRKNNIKNGIIYGTISIIALFIAIRYLYQNKKDNPKLELKSQAPIAPPKTVFMVENAKTTIPKNNFTFSTQKKKCCPYCGCELESEFDQICLNCKKFL